MSSHRTRLCFMAVLTWLLLPFSLSATQVDTSAFRQFVEVKNMSHLVPTVVAVPVNQLSLERSDAAVLDLESGTIEPHYLISSYRGEVPVQASAKAAQNTAHFMTDGDVRTYAEFSVSDEGAVVASITLRSPQPITTSAMTILLDSHVALPQTVAVRAVSDGVERIVVAKRALKGQRVQFPKTVADEWIITFEHSQPLRIAELALAQENSGIVREQAVRFLAQPERDYRIYLDADRVTSFDVGESGNLRIDEGVKVVAASAPQPNPTYKIADVDNDGVADIHDNCVRVTNTDQADIDGNGRGDACDDFDRDGIIGAADNCANHPNRDQADTDDDGIGDACDKEESRLTEKHAWLPWLGIGFAGMVIVVLLSITVATMHRPASEIETTEGSVENSDEEA